MVCIVGAPEKRWGGAGTTRVFVGTDAPLMSVNVGGCTTPRLGGFGGKYFFVTFVSTDEKPDLTTALPGEKI